MRMSYLGCAGQAPGATLIKGKTMAKPIKATPVLTGERATAFLKKVAEGLKNPTPLVVVKNAKKMKEMAFALGKCRA